jgi:hypothetical protein
MKSYFISRNNLIVLGSSQRDLDGLSLAAQLLVELALGVGVCAGQPLVEDIDRLIDGIAVALPEKAD